MFVVRSRINILQPLARMALCQNPPEVSFIVDIEAKMRVRKCVCAALFLVLCMCAGMCDEHEGHDTTQIKT